jgi:L-threonylcarbamoyladenylate synthase
MIDVQAIARVLGHRPEQSGVNIGAPRVSGSLAAHYAPRTPMQLVTSADLAAAVASALGRGLRLAVLARQSLPSGAESEPRLYWHHASADVTDFAHELYADLRELDAHGLDLMLVEAPPATETWDALADRLGRAVAGSGSHG